MLKPEFFKQTILFGIALVGVQGTIYLFQFMAAAQMTAVNFATVRVIESLATVCTLLATFGLPSLALVRVGIPQSNSKRTKLITNILAVYVIFASIVLSITYAALSLGDDLGPTKGKLRFVITLAALIGFRLLLTTILQARQQFVTLATLSLFGCGVSLVLFFLLMQYNFDPVTSWLLARCALEGIICLGAALIQFWPSKKTQNNVVEIAISETTNNISDVWPLIVASVPVGGSLVARSLIDHGPVLWLATIGANSVLIGQVGLLLTIVTVSMLPGLIVQGAAVPRLAAKLADRNSMSSYFRMLSAISILTAIIFLLLVIVSERLLGWVGLVSASILMAGASIVTSKMLASAMGGYLLVLNRGATILKINMSTLLIAISVAVGLTWLGTLNVLTVSTCLAFIEISAALCYFYYFTKKTKML